MQSSRVECAPKSSGCASGELFPSGQLGGTTAVASSAASFVDREDLLHRQLARTARVEVPQETHPIELGRFVGKIHGTWGLALRVSPLHRLLTRPAHGGRNRLATVERRAGCARRARIIEKFLVVDEGTFRLVGRVPDLRRIELREALNLSIQRLLDGL